MTKYSNLFGANTGVPGGWKVYTSEVTYSSVPAGWNLLYAEWVPYKDPITQKWRLRFNIYATVTATTSANLTVDGVTFLTTSAITTTTDSVAIASRAFTTASTGVINVRHEANNVAFYLSGDVPLASKPTWADFDGTTKFLTKDVLTNTEVFVSEGVSGAQNLVNNAITDLTVFQNTYNNVNFNILTNEYTAPANGYYQISLIATVAFVGGVNLNVGLKKNGTKHIESSDVGTATNSFVRGHTAATIYLIAGDVIRPYVYQNSGADRNSSTVVGDMHFSIVKVPTYSGTVEPGYGAATESVAGLISPLTQIIGGNKEFTGTINLSKTTDTHYLGRFAWFGNNFAKSGSNAYQFSTNYSATGRVMDIMAGSVINDSTPSMRIGKYGATNTTAQKFIEFVVNQYNIGNGQINGNGASQAAFGTFSDERLKNNIKELTSEYLEKIMKLRPVEFDYKDGSGHQIGFIAQEVQKVFPDMVSVDSQTGMLMLSGLDKQKSILIKAIQEIKKEKDEQIEKLTEMVKDLTDRIIELESAI